LTEGIEKYTFFRKILKFDCFFGTIPPSRRSAAHLSLKAWLRTPLHKGGFDSVQNHTFLTNWNRPGSEEPGRFLFMDIFLEKILLSDVIDYVKMTTRSLQNSI